MPRKTKEINEEKGKTKATVKRNAVAKSSVSKKSTEEKIKKSKSGAVKKVDAKAQEKKVSKPETKKAVKEVKEKATKTSTKKTAKTSDKKNIKPEIKKVVKKVKEKVTKALTKKSTKNTDKTPDKKIVKPEIKKAVKEVKEKVTKALTKKADKTTAKASDKKIVKPEIKKTVKEVKEKTSKTPTKEATKTPIKKDANPETKKAVKEVKEKTPKSSAKKVTKTPIKKIAKPETKKAVKEVKEKNSKTSTKKATKTGTKKITSNNPVTKSLVKNKDIRKTKAFKPEYYDLPYVYNQTVIKLLAQTPTNIFVYWEISQNDVSNFIKKYGDNFFNDTMPVLSVYNEDMNYYFDVFINDYANSWYINVPDESCKYRVTLKRVFKEPIPSTPNYVEIATSNEIIIPNGHVLFDSISDRVEYINLRTKNKYYRVFVNRNKNFINKFYKDYYIEKFGLDNPSSIFNQI